MFVLEGSAQLPPEMMRRGYYMLSPNPQGIPWTVTSSSPTISATWGGFVTFDVALRFRDTSRTRPSGERGKREPSCIRISHTRIRSPLPLARQAQRRRHVLQYLIPWRPSPHELSAVEGSVRWYTRLSRDNATHDSAVFNGPQNRIQGIGAESYTNS